MKVLIQLDAYTWRVADKTRRVAGEGCYESRLQNSLRINQSLLKSGSAPQTMEIVIRNNDGFILSSINLWFALVTVTTDTDRVWVGRVTAYESDGSGLLYLTVTEKTAPELSVQIPDEVARLVSVDENWHVSALNVTLPIPVGGTIAKPIALKGILIDKLNGVYLLSVGELHQVVNIRAGDKIMPLAEAEAAGYAAYTGAADQAERPGFAYVQIVDPDLRKNDDGSYVDIGAEVVGVKLGSHTIEECRNGARFLQWLLKTPKEGAGGWGLGLAESDINLTAFATAIADVDAFGRKLDGILYFRQVAQSWIDQICLAIGGSYSIGQDGKRHLWIDKPSASVKTYDARNMRLLRHGRGAFTGQVYNKGLLQHSYNPITGMFMQSANYQNSASIEAIDEQPFAGQSYLLRDAATAQAILEYTCKKSLIAAQKVRFETIECPEEITKGAVVTINRPDVGLVGDYQITDINIGDWIAELTVAKSDAFIYTVDGEGSEIPWSQDPPIVSAVTPGAPSGLVLSASVDYDSAGDGAARPFIEGTFTPPEGKYLGAAVFWGLGAEPETWNSHGSIRGTTFRVGPVKAGQLYTVKVHLFNQSGPSAEITGSIVGGSHTELPPAPTATASAGLGCIVVNIAMPAFSALAGFDIQRQTSAGADLTTVASGHRSTFFPDDSPSIIAAYDTYQYRVRAVSNSRQTSAWSAWTTSVSATQAQSKDITANQIIAKDFRTACNVGASQNGVMFNCAGIQAWCNGTKTVDIPTSGSPTFSGTITAAAGNIGGWCIDSTKLCRTCLVLGQFSTYGTGLAVYDGAGKLGIQIMQGCLFDGISYVDASGILIRNSSGIQTFRSTFNPYCAGGDCSKIAGWDFNHACLWSNNILLDSAGSIQTCDFVTGNKGWKIDCVGNAEFNNVCARGAIRTAVFVKDEISVVGGCTMIRPAAVWDCGGAINSTCFIVYADDFAGFAINDIVRIKDGVNDVWGVVKTCGCSGTYPTLDYMCIGYCSGTSGWSPTKGQAIVNYGSCAGCGGIMLNGQAPYIDLYTHSGTPWNGTCSRARLGNLNGWGTFSTDTYGLALGSPTDSHRLTYDTGSGLLCIFGDIQVSGTGNILPDPSFSAIKVSHGSTILNYGGGTATFGDHLFYVSADCALVQFYSASTTSCSNHRHADASAVRLRATTNTSCALMRSTVNTPIAAGETYTLSGYLAAHPGYCCPRTYFGVCLFDCDRAFICCVVVLAANCNIPNSATRYSCTFVAPANAAFVRPYVYNHSPAGNSYLYVSALQLETGGLTAWKCNQGGTITANRICSGSLISLNWNGSDIGSCINMDTGVFSFGGKLTWNGTSLGISSCVGDVGGWTIATGCLCSANIVIRSCQAIFTNHSGNYAMHGQMWDCGSWVCAYGFSSSLVTCRAHFMVGEACVDYVAPSGTTIAAGKPFFYVGSSATSYMEYYNDALTVLGTLCATSGCIGGWSVGSFGLVKASRSSCLALYSAMPHIRIRGTDSSGTENYITIGKCVWNGSWLTTHWGIAIRAGDNNLFQASSCGDGSDLCAYIAGWNFNANCLYSGNLIMNSAGAISGCYNGTTTGWCINAAGDAVFNNATVRGTVCAASGKIGCFSLCSGLLCGTGIGSWCGIFMYDSSIYCSGLGAASLRFWTTNTCSTVCGSGLSTDSYGGVCYAATYLSTGLSLKACISGSTSCSQISLLSGQSGSSATFAPFTIYMYASASCYAFCTNARISVAGTVYPSDRNLKTDFSVVAVLPLLRQMPVLKWRFKDSKDYQIGPVAQDFNCIFKMNHDWETNLTVSGLDGIALRGVQELDECVAYNNRRILDLESRNACLETRIDCLTKELLQLKAA